MCVKAKQAICTNTRFYQNLSWKIQFFNYTGWRFRRILFENFGTPIWGSDSDWLTWSSLTGMSVGRFDGITTRKCGRTFWLTGDVAVGDVAICLFCKVKTRINYMEKLLFDNFSRKSYLVLWKPDTPSTSITASFHLFFSSRLQSFL